MSTSPMRDSNEDGSNGNLDEKPRLSEHEKKANHIASGMLSSFLFVVFVIHWFCSARVQCSIAGANSTQSRNADKRSVRASIGSRRLCRASRARAEVRASC